MTRRTLIIVPLLLALVCVTAGSVLAQTTPAGTQIRNRSSASYEDLSGNTYTTTSNEVITVVLSVYGVSVIPDDSGQTPPVTPAMTQNAIPGLNVYYRYDLTNTGNDIDSFSILPLVDAVNTTMGLAVADVDIYHDLNGNGVIDPGEPVISSGGAPGVLGPIASGATASIIVTYAVPAAAATGDVAYVGVDATSQGDPTQNDTRNYHLTNVVNDAVMTANLAGAPPVVFEGQQITYSFSGNNTGNNTANGVNVASVGRTGVLIYDILPTDPSTGNPLPVFGVPVGSPAGGLVLYLPTGSSTAGSPETWPWTSAPAGDDIAVGFVTNGGITPGQAYTFDYQVTVPNGMPAGVVNNTASLAYVDNDPVSPNPTIVGSNNAPVTVGATPVVLIGPQNNAGAGTPPNFNDDVTTVASAYANTSVDFVNTVRNDGNAADEVNVLLDGSSSIPGTWSVLLLRADGITPLVDTGGDGMVDVGILAPGDSIDVVVRVVIPGTQGAGGPFDAVIRGQSGNDPLVYNLTTDRINQVLPAAVNIGNYDGAPGTTNDVPVNQNADPGTSVDFALDVINTGGGPDTYTLSAAVPGGWTATFYRDANGNGVLDPAETVPIVATGPIPGGVEWNLIARVDVPAGTPPGVNPTSFTATSTNNPGESDTIANTVTVNSFASVDFSPDQAGSSTPGGTISYPHTVTNTGNVADTWDLTFVSSQGWTYVFYDALNNPINSVTLAPGATENITVRLTVPAGATVGTVETGVLSATGQVTLVADSATDVTVIVAGNLQLTKSVLPVGNQLPGTDLTYTVDYRNIGTDALTAVVIYDALPAWTWFQVGSVTTGTPPGSITGVTVEYSDDNGATWAYAPASGAGGAPAGYDANVTNVRYVLTGDIAAGDGSSIGLGFAVRIMN
jgi:uncharacterized repeat protein (TIGR01451 family)